MNSTMTPIIWVWLQRCAYCIFPKVLNFREDAAKLSGSCLLNFEEDPFCNKSCNKMQQEKFAYCVTFLV